MQPDLVRVCSPAERFSPLFAAARSRSVLIGWLDLESAPEPPAGLADAASSGALRAVSIAGGEIVSVKHLAGSPVLRDVVREHFTGCRLLLVRGDIEAPLLAPDSDRWVITRSGGFESRYSSEEVLDGLRSPLFLRGGS